MIQIMKYDNYSKIHVVVITDSTLFRTNLKKFYSNILVFLYTNYVVISGNCNYTLN